MFKLKMKDAKFNNSVPQEILDFGLFACILSLGFFILPTRFFNPGYFTPVGQFPKTNPAEIKIPQVTPFATATETAAHHPGFELGWLQSSGND